MRTANKSNFIFLVKGKMKLNMDTMSFLPNLDTELLQARLQSDGVANNQ